MEVKDINSVDQYRELLKTLMGNGEFTHVYTTTSENNERTTEEWGVNVNLSEKEFKEAWEDETMQLRLERLLQE